VDDALGSRAQRRDPAGRVDIVAADPLALLAASVPRARGMSAETLRTHVSDQKSKDLRI